MRKFHPRRILCRYIYFMPGKLFNFVTIIERFLSLMANGMGQKTNHNTIYIAMQVFHVCESGKRQSSFICPKGTIFNQKHRVCDWWYNVKCEDSTEFYDLNLDLLLLEKKKDGVRGQTQLNVPPPIDPLAGLFDGAVGLGDSLLDSLSSNEASDILGGVRVV